MLADHVGDRGRSARVGVTAGAPADAERRVFTLRATRLFTALFALLVHSQDQLIAKIDQGLCIKCGLCHIACEDTSHQAIAALRVDGARRYEVIDAECVGCNLCQHVCPVPDCITMVSVDTGKPYLNWTQDPRNPHAKKAAE